jgi:hypothetical protein
MDGQIRKLKSSTGYMYPVTTAEAVFMTKNVTIKEKIRELENMIHNSFNLNWMNDVDIDTGTLSSGDILTNIRGVWKARRMGGNLTIEPEIWGIEQGFPTKPYTDSDYRKAFNNIRGINKALKYASDNGYSQATLPKSTYSICYPEPVKMIDNLTLNLGGSALKVMFESDKDSPYYNGTLLTGSELANVFLFSGVKNSHLTNGELIGDKYERIWVIGESAVENTYGASINKGSSYCSISHCEIHGFMGDNINFAAGGKGMAGFTTGAIRGDINIVTGALEPSDVSTTMYTNFQAIPVGFKTFSLGGQGYSRTTNLANKRIDVYYYKENGTFLGLLKNRKVQAPITIADEATKFRMKFYDETDITKDFSIFLNYGADNNHNVVEYNELYDGHRGGITGGGSYNVIQYNTIRDNGKYINGFLNGNDPIFPDTTRYSINQEDSFGDNNVIRHNHIYGSFHGILVGSFSIFIEGNVINNVEASSIVLYSVEYAKVSGNYIQNGAIQLFGGGLPGNIQIQGNYLRGVSCDSPDYKATITGNHIIDADIDTGDSIFRDNTVVLSLPCNISGNQIKGNKFIGISPIVKPEITVLGTGTPVLDDNEFQDVSLLVNTGALSSVIRRSKFIRSNIMTSSAPNGQKIHIRQCELIDTLLSPRAGSLMDGLLFTVTDCDISVSADSGMTSLTKIFTGNVVGIFKIVIDNCRISVSNPAFTDIIKFNYIYNSTTRAHIKSCTIEYIGATPLAVKYFSEARVSAGTLSDNLLKNVTMTPLTDTKYTFHNPDFSYVESPVMAQVGGTGDYKSVVTHNLQTKQPYVFVTLSTGEIIRPTVKIVNENSLEISNPTNLSTTVFVKRL